MIVQAKRLVSLVLCLEEIIELRSGLSALDNDERIAPIGLKLKDQLDSLISELESEID